MRVASRLGYGVAAILVAGLTAGSARCLPAGAERGDGAQPEGRSATWAPATVPPPDPGFLGVIVPADAVDVAARAEGRVEEVRVRLGDTVQREQVLARLDDRALRGDRAMAQAALEGARADERKAEYELAEARERRARWDKAARGTVLVVSPEELDKLSYAVKYAAQQLEMARARSAGKLAEVAEVDRKLGDTVIRARFGGRIAARYVEPGATVAIGTPVARIVSIDALWIRFAVPEDRSDAVALGMEVTASGDSLGTQLRGMIEKISPEIDAAAQMIVVEARIATPSDAATTTLAGRVVRVRVHPP